jgi:hypothetical protein
MRELIDKLAPPVIDETYPTWTRKCSGSTAKCCGAALERLSRAHVQRFALGRVK